MHPFLLSVSILQTSVQSNSMPCHILHCREFGRPGPFWGRYYIFWHAGQPLTVIQEVFSPGMDEWLGPSSPPVH